ncbi:methionine aminotransferase [Salinisphaera sp. T31B1]|uniref:methionine aminotransferase n=1 Tax=Salinisphaera sp. T31B1 TaxID=727963 RepID=UPI00333F51D9
MTPSLDSKLPRVGTTIFSVMSQLAVEHDAVNLGQGFPDFEPPAALTEALSRAMADGHNQYPPGIGLAALREQIAIKTEALYGRPTDPAAEVTVTSGATEAIFAAIAAVVRAHDEVIVLDPAYDCYQPAIELQNARAVRVPLQRPGFTVDWQRVADAITARTRLIIINSPHNPTGAVFGPDDLTALAEVLRGTGVWVLSDEVYEHMVFDGAAHQSVGRVPELAARSFIVSSFGKTFHCTGWKVGYCIAPPALTVEFRKVHQYLTFATFAPAQWAFATILCDEPHHYRDLSGFYQAKRDGFRRLLADTPLQLLDVPGGYFQLVDYSAVRDMDDVAFSQWLVRVAGVATVPLSPFYDDPPATRLVRLCFAKNEATLTEGARRLTTLAGD